ncbi:hypothetical protein [Burkholderia sp. GS2Y]|uniref:Uncharacterized protein n=1 Tax=Burkholderia theae TaxID=3143496 RepID=A0ABU9WUN2_9BURK
MLIGVASTTVPARSIQINPRHHPVYCVRECALAGALRRQVQFKVSVLHALHVPWLDDSLQAHPDVIRAGFAQQPKQSRFGAENSGMTLPLSSVLRKGMRRLFHALENDFRVSMFISPVKPTIISPSN